MLQRAFEEEYAEELYQDISVDQGVIAVTSVLNVATAGIYAEVYASMLIEGYGIQGYIANTVSWFATTVGAAGTSAIFSVNLYNLRDWLRGDPEATPEEMTKMFRGGLIWGMACAPIKDPVVNSFVSTGIGVITSE